MYIILVVQSYRYDENKTEFLNRSKFAFVQNIAGHSVHMNEIQPYDWYYTHFMQQQPDTIFVVLGDHGWHGADYSTEDKNLGKLLHRKRNLKKNGS